METAALEKLTAENAEKAKVEALLYKETERARHFEDISVERQRLTDDFKGQVSVLQVEKNHDRAKLSAANARLDDLAAERDSLKEQLVAAEKKFICGAKAATRFDGGDGLQEDATYNIGEYDELRGPP